MNFGIEVLDHSIELYFHCAKEGKKLDLMKANPHVAFEMDCSHHLLLGNSDCASTMEYESICGNGSIEFLPDSQKIHALTQLMKQYVKKDSYHFEEKDMQYATVFKIVVNEIHGKRLKKS
jgi:nitroimidazol reductase NimA-like FMN-containing flavoprotein (pyridoxamine 5'-phosphate oxidase superfamily)